MNNEFTEKEDNSILVGFFLLCIQIRLRCTFFLFIHHNLKINNMLHPSKRFHRKTLNILMGLKESE